MKTEDMKVEYHVKCPMCGQRWAIELTKDQERRFFEYRSKRQMIQEVLPDLNSVEREFLKSGFCPECQKQIFMNGETNKIKKCN